MNIPWDQIIEILFDLLDRCMPAPEMVAGVDAGQQRVAIDACNNKRCKYVRDNLDDLRFRAILRRAVRNAGTPLRLRGEAVEDLLDKLRASTDEELCALVSWDCC